MDKEQNSLYRVLGIVGSTSTMISSLVWIFLCFLAMYNFIIGGPSYEDEYHMAIKSHRYKEHFAVLYFNKKLTVETQSLLTPLIVFILNLFYLVLSTQQFVVSVLTRKEFSKWENEKLIRFYGNLWIFITLFTCMYVLILAIIFFTDYTVISKKISVQSIAISAFTMATLYMKGYLIWLFHIVIALIMFYISFLKKRPLQFQ